MKASTWTRGALPSLVLAAVALTSTGCGPQDNPGAPPAQIVEVTAKKNQTGADITIKGKQFRPHHLFKVNYSGGPIQGVQHGGTTWAEADGTLKLVDTVVCIEANHDDAFGTVLLTVQDQSIPASQSPSPDEIALESLSATYWVCS
jgi:hypothetical protein